MKAQPADVVLITGFPSFLSEHLARRLLAQQSRTRLKLLVHGKGHAQATEFVSTLGPSARKRIALLQGDVSAMDLGLSGADYQQVVEEVTIIHHAASATASKREILERVNVVGTEMVLETARDCRNLARLIHWSTARVSGTRSGVILEEELDEGQRFPGVFEETRFQAERRVRAAMSRLPITVVRPGMIVGDSKTGEIDRYSGIYYTISALVSAPQKMRLPLPGRGEGPLNIVPVDYVIDAAIALSRDPRAAGKTLHLTDPSPLSVRAAVELIAKAAKRKAPRGAIPTGWARALLKAPGLERLSRAPRSFLEAISQNTYYNCRTTLALLAGTDITCPSFDLYVDAIVKYGTKVQARDAHPNDPDIESADDTDSLDPLD